MIPAIVTICLLVLYTVSYCILRNRRLVPVSDLLDGMPVDMLNSIGYKGENPMGISVRRRTAFSRIFAPLLWLEDRRGKFSVMWQETKIALMDADGKMRYRDATNEEIQQMHAEVQSEGAPSD